MSSNHFGNQFRFTTWGESHGKAIGVVIDGCPAGLPLSEDAINEELQRRAPGKNPFTSPRKEPDRAQILSGTFQGVTTGTPISIMIFNEDADSSRYEPTKDLLKPGHANVTYLAKYGVFDYRGGGRSSARETACRVAAGFVAKLLLKHFDVQVMAYLQQVGAIKAKVQATSLSALASPTRQSPIFCPDKDAEKEMMKALEEVVAAGDSLGGLVAFLTSSLPVGLGDPVYEKLDANLAKAMLSLPAAKGFDIGSGFDSVVMRGSEHNDPFIVEGGRTRTTTNHAGGVLAGITTGMPLYGRVAFKPTASIRKPQATVDVHGNTKTFEQPFGSRHDPCVAIRAVPVVEAMLALVLADALLMNRSAKL